MREVALLRANLLARVAFSTWWAVLACLAAGTAFAGDDVLTIRNGDRLTGDVKLLDRGLLRFKTDATDTVSVKWEQVAAVSSTQNFEIALDDGQRLFGSLEQSTTPGNIVLATTFGRRDVSIASVVRMTPIESRIIDQIDMDVSLGYSIAKANDVSQTTIGYNFSYRSMQSVLDLNVNLAESMSQDNPKSQRANTRFAYQRMREDRQWDPIALGIVERNDELGLERRFTMGGGMSRWFSDTSSNRISFAGGLVYTREEESLATESQESVEAAIGLNLDWFRYSDPELDVKMRLSLFERLSDSQRSRGNLDVDFRWELIQDFFLGFNVYYSFNTAPIDLSSKNDYGLVTSLSWSL